MTNLEKLGFVKQTTDIKPRLILSVEGQPKTGKTDFALGAPGPIAVLNMDLGLEGMVHKFASDKEIHSIDIRLPLPPIPKVLIDKEDKRVSREERVEVAEAAGELWNKLKQAYAQCIPEVRTVVIDTCDEAWELLRMARFGKLEQVPGHYYGPLNAEFREFLRMSYDSDVNLILVHKVKKQYRGDNWTGKYERAGFGGVGYFAQVQLLTYHEEESNGSLEYYLKILECKQNPSLAAMEAFPRSLFDGPAFPHIAAMCFEFHETWGDPDAWL